MPRPRLDAFHGTGGAGMQFWHMARTYDGRTGPVRLLFEDQIRGFSPGAKKLVTLQHGVGCPGGAGPDLCRITFLWDERTKRLDATEKRLASSLPPHELRMRYADEALYR